MVTKSAGPEIADPLNTTHSTHANSAYSDGATTQSDPSSSILKVTFQVAENESVGFSIPLSCLEERETEMRQTAQKLNVPSHKWNSSRLYHEYHQTNDNTANSNNNSLFLILHKPWLHSMTLQWIHHYYTAGILQIPSQAHGYDVLAALEYFSILYSPDQCHFADYAVYERVQQWARYLSLRDALTDVVVSKLQAHRALVYYFCTTPTPDARMELGTETAWPLGATASLCKTAHKLFSREIATDNETLPSPPEATADELRQDFCAHLLRTAVVRRAQFDWQPVTVHTQHQLRVVERAVLQVEPQQRQKPKLVFLLPDELELPLSKQRQPVSFVHPEETTVTSGLTGPFYTDELGQKRDVCEDDTFSQAKRHEWVQTALMNRGISERMEELLHPPPANEPSMWEWLTGLGVCEMSRTVMESMEQYVNQVRTPAEEEPPKEEEPVPPPKAPERLVPETTLAPITEPAKPLGHRKPSYVRDRLVQVQAMTAEEPVNTSMDYDSRDSPRGVDEVFHHPEDNKITSIQPVPSPPKRKRGLLKLFRRRKTMGT